MIAVLIEFLHVDLLNCFAVGQAYVACSRGKCIKSMTVKHFKPTEVKTSKKVTAFYEAAKNGKPYTGGMWSDSNWFLIYVESGDIECIVNILGLSTSSITLGGANK
jgi:hypothetical protein